MTQQTEAQQLETWAAEVLARQPGEWVVPERAVAPNLQLLQMPQRQSIEQAQVVAQQARRACSLTRQPETISSRARR